MNDEGFDNYGLRINIIADYSYGENNTTQYQNTLTDPGLDDLCASICQLVETCYAWGISRKDVIERLKLGMDEVGKEY